MADLPLPRQLRAGQTGKLGHLEHTYRYLLDAPEADALATLDDLAQVAGLPDASGQPSGMVVATGPDGSYRLSSTAGIGRDAREIELSTSTTHLRWRYAGQTGWTDLVALADLGDGTVDTDELVSRETTVVGMDGDRNVWRIDIEDDGSPTGPWPDRTEITFAGFPTYWNNEYGELRGMPARRNTVAARWFGAASENRYVDRDPDVPVVTVEDFRNPFAVGRNEMFGVYHDGRVFAAGDVTAPNIGAKVVVIDPGGSVPPGTPPGTVVVERTT